MSAKKYILALLVLVPLVLAVDLESQLWISEAFYASDVNATAAAPATAVGSNTTAPVVAGGVVNTTLTTPPVLNTTAVTGNATEAKAARRRRRRTGGALSKLSKLVSKVVPAKAHARPPRNARVQTKPVAPKLSPTLAEAEIEFYLRAPNSVVGEDKALFEQRVILELSKGVEQPGRRFEILNVTLGHNARTGPLIRFRINRVTPRDDPRSLGADQIANVFYDRAMDPANVWVNLPLLSHVDRTKAIVVDLKQWKPRPKEPTIHAQIKVDVDIRKIEPQIAAYLRAFEVDVAAAIGCEPEQIEVTGAEPDENGLSLTSLVVQFDVHARLRDLPEAELTPTRIVNDIKKQLLDPKSHLRQRPTLMRADPFFPVQNILPKAKVNPDWVHDREQYQVAEIHPDPVQYARPYVLPTLYVAAPPAP